MSRLELRDELGWCDGCGAFAYDCSCYVFFTWDWDKPNYGFEVDGLEKILDWGSELSILHAPPRHEGPVLDVLPIPLAIELEKYFLEVVFFERSRNENYAIAVQKAQVDYVIIKGKVPTRSVYEALISLVTLDVKETKRMRWPILSHPVIDYLEVENPFLTRKRMEVIVQPAIDAIAALNTTKNKTKRTSDAS